MGGNNLAGLNGHLFEQLNRLSSGDLKGAELTEEIERSKAVTSVATQIVKSAKLTLDAQKLVAEHLRPGAKLPEMLEDPAYTVDDND